MPPVIFHNKVVKAWTSGVITDGTEKGEHD